MATILNTETQAFDSLAGFLDWACPGVEVVQGQGNRVPQPKDLDFIVMTSKLRNRLSTNVREDADAAFTASIAGAVMTVTSVQIGTIEIGATVYGTGVLEGQEVVSQLSGSVGGTAGGTGTYEVSAPQSMASSALAAGQVQIRVPTAFSVQVDVYGPSSGDNAQIISTLMRDPDGVDHFTNGVTPLYAEDPRQMPLVDGEKQYENRYIVEAVMQVDPTVVLPQQYAAVAEVDLIEVDATYPPGG